MILWGSEDKKKKKKKKKKKNFEIQDPILPEKGHGYGNS